MARCREEVLRHRYAMGRYLAVTGEGGLGASTTLYFRRCETRLTGGTAEDAPGSGHSPYISVCRRIIPRPVERRVWARSRIS